jgi:NAD(P)-dependent dehydrogenase (short-subunit alcohol dehydrogenase family)
VRAEGATTTALAGDAADEHSMAEMFAGACEALGGLDGLVLNASTAG